LDITVLKDGGLVNHKIGHPVALPNQANQATQASTGISNGSAYIKPKATPAADFNANASINDTLTHPIASLSPYQNK
jgi:replication factor A1